MALVISTADAQPPDQSELVEPTFQLSNADWQAFPVLGHRVNKKSYQSIHAARFVRALQSWRKQQVWFFGEEVMRRLLFVGIYAFHGANWEMLTAGR
jgi:hypothetical protein